MAVYKNILKGIGVGITIFVVFVFLFGFGEVVLAAECVTGSLNWNKEGSCDYPIIYTDSGGAGLATCEYQVINTGDSLSPTGWLSAIGSCEGSEANLQSGNILIGDIDCTINGQDSCELYGRATDLVGNEIPEERVETFSIDIEKPSVSANNASSSWFFSRNVTLSALDSYSGIRQAWYSWDTPTVYGCVGGEGGFSDGGVIPVPDGSHRLYLCAMDIAGNVNDWDSGPDAYRVDSTPPTVSANPLGGSLWYSNIDVTLSVSEIGGSGLLYARYSWDEPMNETCTSGGIVYTDGTLLNVDEGSHRLYLCARDGVNNVGVFDGEYNVDKIAPTVDSFTIDGNSYDSVVITRKSVEIIWSSSDTGGSGIKKHEIWIAPDNGGVPGTWTLIKDDADPTIPFDHDPGGGTWWYGIHSFDNAKNDIGEYNCITEDGGHCENGGVTSDSLDPRDIKGPIKVVYQVIGRPNVRTDSADVTGASAQLNGTLISDGGEETEVQFRWGDIDSSENETVWEGGKVSGDTFSFITPTLLKGHIYHFKAQAKNTSNILVIGASKTFKILPDAPYNLHASGDGPFAINLSWTKGDGADRTMIRRKTGGFPTSINNGTEVYNGTGSSAIDTGLTESTTYYYRAWSVAEDEELTIESSLFDEVIESTTVSNSPPSISSVSDAPDPSSDNVSVVFDVFWSDPDGDSVKLFICKLANGVTGGNCQGGNPNTWCKDASFTSISPAKCSYITDSGDAGSNNYYAYVCDDSSACSSPKSGSFLVDPVLPTISSFDVTPIPPEWISSISEDVTISWTVGDSGGSFLKEVQVWRSGDGGGSWVLASTVSAPLSSNSWESFTTDAPSSGTYLYGIHVLDNAENEITESEAGFTPISIQADTTNPTAAITNPGAGVWFKEDFIATFDDSDLGGSGLVNICEYRFIGLNPSGPDLTSGDLTRDCDFDTKTITVGVGGVCQFEGQNRCKVQTKAFDNAGNTSGWQSRSFGVDFTDPEVTNLQPSAVQVGAVTTLTADLTDPIGHVIGCSLFTAPVGGEDWTLADSTTINPIPCENGGICTVSGEYTFPDIGEYQVTFGCTDQAGNTGWGASTTQADTLSVVGEAIPSAGTQQTQFDLTATVSGTIVGTINYKFDCTSDGIWELEVNGETDTTYIAEDVCSYSSEDTYTAKVLAERGVGSAEDTISIVVSSNASPSAINLQDNNDTVDYCPAGAPPIILSWDFDDPNLPGDSQSAYQVQVDINSGFSSPEIDSGKVASSSTNYVPLGFSYDERYWWRVMVWDMTDASSAWATGTSFTTPVHVYPSTDFSWSPLFPANDEEVQFTDETIFAPISTGQSWSWDFGDTIGSSTEQNPVYIYADTTSYEVTLTASDDVGSCVSSQTIRVSIPLPEWLEISPF